MHQAWEFALDSGVPAELRTGRGSALRVHDGSVQAVKDRLRGADVDWPTRWEQASR
jgi:hypothetical protein